MISVFIADDHEIVREGLKKILREEPDMEICGEAADGLTVADEVMKADPDVLVLDIAMPGRSGLEIAQDLHSLAPRLPIVVLSMHPEERFAVRAIRAGAAGYVNKQSAAASLVSAIRKVHAGGKFISEAVAEQLARELETGAENLPHTQLSNREFQVFCFIAQGKTTQEIALELSVSVPTVKTYRMRILDKTGLKSNAEVIHYALEHKLVD